MQPLRTSIWLHDPNQTASGKPGTLQIAIFVDVDVVFELGFAA
jgi:hypothetical protein